ncbi:dapper homolog 3-like [Lathamus discolor]|uniref:dapper homolog 3-like n=1 Tax=Lathamus discolor TaxID=678569 RepID=UPI0032B77D34
MPEADSHRPQRSPPPAPLRLAPSSPCRHPAAPAAETPSGFLSPHRCPSAAPRSPREAAPGWERTARNTPSPSAPLSEHRPEHEHRAGGEGPGRTGVTCRRRSAAGRGDALLRARCLRLTPPWPQPRRAARAPLSPTKFAARQLRASAGPSAPPRRRGSGSRGGRPLPGVRDSGPVVALPATAAPGCGDELALPPSLPLAPPSGPAKKLRVVQTCEQRRPSASTTKHDKSCRAAAAIAGGRKEIGGNGGKAAGEGESRGCWGTQGLPRDGTQQVEETRESWAPAAAWAAPVVGEAREYLRRVRPWRAALPAPRTRDPPRTLRAPFARREPTRQTPVSWASGARRGAAHRQPVPGSSPAPRGSPPAPAVRRWHSCYHVEACGVSLSAPCPPLPALPGTGSTCQPRKFMFGPPASSPRCGGPGQRDVAPRAWGAPAPSSATS